MKMWNLICFRFSFSLSFMGLIKPYKIKIKIKRIGEDVEFDMF